MPVVEITTSGRGGSITYREDGHTIGFDWEFAMSPALALAWGPRRDEWPTRCPWASGRQEAIYQFVGAEVVRQQAPDGGFEFDLDQGQLTILTAIGARSQRHASKTPPN